MNPQPNMLYIHALIKMTREEKINFMLFVELRAKKRESNLAFTCFKANILEKIACATAF